MFSRKKDKSPKTQAQQDTTKQPARKSGSGIPSIIAADLKILGNIASDGVLDLDGIVEGNVKCHTLTLRKSGHIKGDVLAETVHIYGRIQGLIKARNVHFFKGGRAEGVIMHESITIEDGAFVDGRFKRVENINVDESHDGRVDIATLPADSEPRKLFGPGSDVDYDLDSPSFMLNDEEDSQQEAEAASKSPKRSRKKQESVLDNLRLISDSNN